MWLLLVGVFVIFHVVAAGVVAVAVAVAVAVVVVVVDDVLSIIGRFSRGPAPPFAARPSRPALPQRALPRPVAAV